MMRSSLVGETLGSDLLARAGLLIRAGGLLLIALELMQ